MSSTEPKKLKLRCRNCSDDYEIEAPIELKLDQTSPASLRLPCPECGRLGEVIHESPPATENATNLASPMRSPLGMQMILPEFFSGLPMGLPSLFGDDRSANLLQMMEAQRNVDIEAWIQQQMALEAIQPTDPKYIDELKSEHCHAITSRDFYQLCLAVSGVSRLLFPAPASFGRDVLSEFEKMKDTLVLQDSNSQPLNTSAGDATMQDEKKVSGKIGIVAEGILLGVTPPTGNADVNALADELYKAWLLVQKQSSETSLDAEGDTKDSTSSTKKVDITIYATRGEISFAEKLRRFQAAADLVTSRLEADAHTFRFRALLVSQTDKEASWPYTMTDSTGLISINHPVAASMLSHPDSTEVESSLRKAQASGKFVTTTLFVRRCAPYCPICVGDCELGEQVMTLPCGHSLHAECLEPWLAKQHSCPLCRHPLPRKPASPAASAQGVRNVPAVETSKYMYT